MIKSWKHKGLKKFFKTGDISGIDPAHAGKLKRQLAQLDVASVPKDMNLPGWDWHPLKGDMKDHFAVSVNGNWRLTFKFEDGHAHVVDYKDYH